MSSTLTLTQLTSLIPCSISSLLLWCWPCHRQRSMQLGISLLMAAGLLLEALQTHNLLPLLLHSNKAHC